ncbi:MAG: CBS domain-containing protein [Phycisphaerales bacterium]|nr:CBS domain-containing protein [Phycisphaerales bacterium]
MISTNTATKPEDVMAAEPLRLEASTTIRHLAHVLSESRIASAPVVNQDRDLIGVVLKTDLLRAGSAAAPGCSPAYLFEVLIEQGGEDTVEDSAMQGHVTVTPDTTIAAVARLMRDRRIHRVILVDTDELPAVIITTLDLLDAFRQQRQAQHGGRVGPRKASHHIHQRSTP